MPKAKRKTRTAKKAKKFVDEGFVYVKSSFNNTIITLTDKNGDVIAIESGGTVGFKGSRKSTPFAASQAAGMIIRKMADVGMKSIEIRVKGPGPGRESAIRALQASGVEVKLIKDITRHPHNGCRPKKKKRY
ncbi:MAG TPA: 30S ribosomal protein S11 [Firmicutes bacterium]|nr:MAG: 30S ribosomal protein S11 [Candidatus Coatesbacteria bacterium]RLC41696.1 MAG: 30S ribosomal protein S11 [Candidatus Coatesbacteria bacterium]RLC43227.1 MAG: 30S ribosomal protein S11 [Candidatus Coatesbacteria bacterium]HDM43555.1 30S ribosomal protein S11 [Bacillota bacterium]HEC79818.1 30S ribosomal protein S11 [Bacillota bacterium]